MTPEYWKLHTAKNISDGKLAVSHLKVNLVFNDIFRILSDSWWFNSNNSLFYIILFNFGNTKNNFRRIASGFLEFQNEI